MLNVAADVKDFKLLDAN